MFALVLLSSETDGRPPLLFTVGRGRGWERRPPPTDASVSSARRGKFSPDVSSNKREAAGMEGGIRPVSGVTPLLHAPPPRSSSTFMGWSDTWEWKERSGRARLISELACLEQKLRR